MDDHHRERVDPVKRIIDDIGLTTRNGEWTKWCYIVKRGGEGSRGQDWLFSLIYSLGSLSLRPPFCKPISFRSFFFFFSLSFEFFPRSLFFLLSVSFFFSPSSSFFEISRVRACAQNVKSKRNIPLYDWSIFFFVGLPVRFFFGSAPGRKVGNENKRHRNSFFREDLTTFTVNGEPYEKGY